MNLSVKNLPAGSTVVVTCKTKKKKQQKKGCPYKSKRFTTTGARARLNLRKPFAKKRHPGRDEGHDQYHGARLPGQERHVHHAGAQAAQVARAVPERQRQGRQLRLS